MAIEKGVVLSVYVFCFLVGLPFNIVACYAFLKKVRQKPTPSDIFLLSLTLSDLILLIFLIFKMVEAVWDNTWPLPSFLCPLTNFFFYSSIYLSSLFLMGISVERYLCVAFPVKYKLNRKPTYTVMASVFFLLLASAHCGAIVYAVEYYNGTLIIKDGTTCYDQFSDKQLEILLPFRLELCVVLFIIPFIITLFCYGSVIYLLTTMPNIPPHKKKRAVGLAVATVLNFAIAFAPYNTSHIVGFIQQQSPSWRVATFLLTTFNTVLDPIIFYFSSTTFRHIFRDCWAGMCRKLQSVLSPCCRCHGNNATEAGTTGPAGGLNASNEQILAGIPTAFTVQRSGTTDS